VAVVNGVLAKHYWPNRDPIGKRMRLHGRAGRWVEIVGVAKTTKYLWVGEGPTDFLYLPLAQRPSQQMTLLALSSGYPANVAEPLRQVVRGIDANLRVFGVKPFEEFYQFRAVSQPGLIVQTMRLDGVIVIRANSLENLSLIVADPERFIAREGAAITFQKSGNQALATLFLKRTPENSSTGNPSGRT
jgi:hypothetical protein